GLVAGVAASTHSALQQNDPLARSGEVGEHLLAFLIQHLRADGDLDHEVFRALARAVPAHAVTTAGGFEMLRIPEVDQGVEAGHRLHDDVAAPAAIAAIGAAIFDVFLAPEAYRSGSAPA